MTTNYLNDVDEVIVTKVTENVAPHISAKIAAGWHSGITTGKLVALDSNFQIREADARASVYLPTVGVCILDANQAYTLGTKTGTKQFVNADAYNNDVTVKMATISPVLSNGPVWLSSGGDITQNYPDKTGDIRQQVGWAVGAQEWCVQICDAETIGR